MSNDDTMNVNFYKGKVGLITRHLVNVLNELIGPFESERLLKDDR